MWGIQISNCPEGYYCTGSNINGNENPCPAGKSSNSSAKSSSDCSSCQPGQYSNASTNYICTKCPTGSYCPSPGMSSPTTCPAGSYCPNAGMSSSPDCPAGSYCSSPTTINQCPAGYYCPVKTKDYTLNLCPVGNYCQLGSSVPISCPAGYYCPNAGMSSAQGCGPGLYQDEWGKTSCKTCSASYYCPDSANSGQTPCPVNKYSPSGKTSCDYYFVKNGQLSGRCIYDGYDWNEVDNKCKAAFGDVASSTRSNDSRTNTEKCWSSNYHRYVCNVGDYYATEFNGTILYGDSSNGNDESPLTPGGFTRSLT